jgi:integrase
MPGVDTGFAMAPESKKKAEPLTVKRISKLVEPGRYRDGGERGLYLQVLSPTNRSWLLRFERGGRERWMGLGPLDDFTLTEARERARQARQQLHDGIDPIDARKAKRAQQALEAAKAITFAEATQRYFDHHEAKWRNAKHRAQFLNTLKQYAFPVLGKLSVAGIDESLVLKVIEPIWKNKTETASRVRGRIESVLDWATVRKYREGENPARWKGHLAHQLPARGQIARVQHHKALPFASMPDFMVQLVEREGMAARALEFLILSAARTGEVISARWEEVDLPEKMWTIPASRMKAHREHRVPLSDRAVAILQALPRETEFLFPGVRRGVPISNMAMAQVLKRMERDDITVHGFRSTFRDWAAERTTYPNHVVEMALAHVIGDKVEAAYRRGDLLSKRARLMEDWARYCATPQRNATVTPIRARVGKP